MNKFKLIGTLMFMIVCASCQNEVLEQNVVSDKLKAESFDLKYLYDNADSIFYDKTFTVINESRTLVDSTKNVENKNARGGIIDGEEVWYNGKCYYIVARPATHMLTHPAITSTITAGLCGLVANVYYTYHCVYEGSGAGYATYYTCVADIERVIVQMQNTSSLYLLWQDQGSRAFCMSSSIDPILYPQERIYVIIEGRIVGDRGFFNPYEEADEPITYQGSFLIPMQ